MLTTENLHGLCVRYKELGDAMLEYAHEHGARSAFDSPVAAKLAPVMDRLTAEFVERGVLDGKAGNVMAGLGLPFAVRAWLDGYESGRPHMS